MKSEPSLTDCKNNLQTGFSCKCHEGTATIMEHFWLQMKKYCVNLCRSCIRQTQSLYSHHIEQQLQIDITINDVGLTATSDKMLFISGVQTGVNDETT